MEVEPTAASAEPLEQALIEALLALSWPLPRTVEDADAALTRLEEVMGVLTLLEQQSIGTEAWWAGQVDGLATQSGFVLEWWRPVLYDPDLDWTLNHQAHLTADLATLASAGARLLDQIGPRAAEEAAEAAHARKAAQEKRWGPAAVPPFVPTGPRPGAPGSRPLPPGQVFGSAAPVVDAPAALPTRPTQPAPSSVPPAMPIPVAAAEPAAWSVPPVMPVQPVGAQPAPSFTPPVQPVTAAAESAPSSIPSVQPVAAAAEPVPVPIPFPAPSGDLNAPEFPPAPPAAASPALFDPAAPPVAAPASIPAQDSPEPEPISEPQAAAIRPFAPLPVAEGSMTSARHRRPAYDFDEPQSSAPPPAVFPQGGPPPRSPIVPGPGFGGPAHHGRTLAPGDPYHSAGYASGPLGFVGEDDDEPDSLVPTGLRRHQRRLLIQTGAILGAIGVLCWWAVYTVSSPSAHSSAAGDATHTAGSTGHTVAAGGLSAPQSASPTPGGKPTDSASSPAAAPSTATSSVPDATTVSSVRVTLLGGSGAVPQIAVLISVDTAGTGEVTVTGSYYGAAGSTRVSPETERWTLSGKTSYQYSVPIANSAYCGTQFHFTANAGGHSDAEETSPGC